MIVRGKMKSTVIFLTLFLVSGVPAFQRGFQWWRGAEIYDIYVPSYMDSNNDGIGDLQGLISKLPHINNLGIKIIKLSTIFKTAEPNTRREGVTNFTEINPVYGNMKDFEQLIREVTRKGIKVIIDLPINHCHTNHEWFQKSRSSIRPYENYFVWERGNRSTVPPQPPNNWLDKTNETAWTFDDKKNKFYYHSYDASLPDLNLRNRKVKQEIKEIMNFWLDKGVAGFNLLGAYAYMESQYSKQNNTLENDFREDQPDTFIFLSKLRKFVDEFTETRWDYERILIVEDRKDEEITLKYFGDRESPLAHIISNREFVNAINITMTSKQLDNLIRPTVTQVQQGRSFEWVTEYSNITRLARRFNNKELTSVVLTILTMLPGITRIYYGQEIGMNEPFPKIMENPDISPWNTHALPMQWNNSTNAGFTLKKEPYAVPNSDYWKVNVEQQHQDKFSQYHMVRNLLKLRKRETLRYGDFKSYIVSERVYAFTRSFRRSETYLTIVNLSNESHTLVDLRSVFANISRTSYVAAASINSVYQKGYKLDALSSLVLRPLSSIVIAFTETDKYSKFG